MRVDMKYFKKHLHKETSLFIYISLKKLTTYAGATSRKKVFLKHSVLPHEHSVLPHGRETYPQHSGTWQNKQAGLTLP